MQQNRESTEYARRVEIVFIFDLIELSKFGVESNFENENFILSHFVGIFIRLIVNIYSYLLAVL